MAIHRYVPLLIKAMRPRQWTKNVLLFAGLYLSHNLLKAQPFKRALAGFALFCLLSGAVYLLNDVIDVERDRLHPRKCKRPIASGELPARVALVACAVASVFGIAASFWMSPAFGLCATAYLLLMLPYSLLLKEIFLIDTLSIAIGFIIRAVSGVIVLRTPTTHVELTSWFVICVMFLALFLAFAKRRSERVKLDRGAASFRPVLAMYSLGLMDKVIGICASGAVLSYTLYATTALSPTRMWSMLTTLPFVLYGVLRYLHLVYSKQDGEAPEMVLTTDLPLLTCVALWALAIMWANTPH